MARYIDAEILEKDILNTFNNIALNFDTAKIMSFCARVGILLNSIIVEQPTADVVSKEKYDELNDRYHRLLESANILADAVRDYERRDDVEIH